MDTEAEAVALQKLYDLLKAMPSRVAFESIGQSDIYEQQYGCVTQHH